MINPVDIPFITANQMAEVDRLMIEVYGIQLLQMMENAGRQLAELAKRSFLGGNAAGKKVIVLAGRGGNGGGALVCARNLHNWGAEVGVFLSKPAEQLTGPIKHQVQILQNINLEVGSLENLAGVHSLDLIIDGILGYSLQGAPRGVPTELINWANAQGNPILALDLPSGVDATTGEVFSPAIRAAATLTLALPKVGLKIAGKHIVGKLYLADIGVPPELYAHVPIFGEVGSLFEAEQIIPLT